MDELGVFLLGSGNCCSKDDEYTLRLKVGIIIHNSSEQENPVNGIGMRFETAESPGIDGAHNYLHAQLFSSFEKGGKTLPNCPPWLPDSMPAIPVNATCPVTLFFCMLKSLYGQQDDLLKNISTQQSINHKLGRDRIQKIKELLDGQPMK